MFRTRRTDPFAGLYEEARKREQAKQGTLLTRVVNEREGRLPSLDFASPFRVESDAKGAEERKLLRFPTVSANSIFSRADPRELGFRTIGRSAKRAKDIPFPAYLTKNEARQEEELRQVEVREQKLAYIKGSQIVYDYTGDAKKKRKSKKGAKATKPVVKAVSKSKEDELEDVDKGEIGSQYTFETLPDGASYDYLVETEEIPAGETHGKITSKPVKLVKKTGEVTPEAATPEAEAEAAPEVAVATEVVTTEPEPEPDAQASAKGIIGEEGVLKEPASESVEKITRFKEGPDEEIRDVTIGDEVVQVAPKNVEKAEKAKKTGEKAEKAEKTEKAGETGEKTGETEEKTGETEENVADDDVPDDVSITSEPVDYNTVPRVRIFPEVEKKQKSWFSPLSFKKKSQKRVVLNPLATPDNPEILVKTDREGFLSKAVYDKVKYENRQHSLWLTEFVESEKQKYEGKQVDYDNKLADLKKEDERLKESMEDVTEDANELIEIRYNRLSKKFLDSTQKYIERKNEVFAETKALQDQTEEEANGIRKKHDEVQKEIATLNAEKDNVHREFISWTNRLADYSAQLDAKMHSLYMLQQKHAKVQAELDEFSKKKGDLEKEIDGHNVVHAENTKKLESKKHSPRVHEIDEKISNILKELTVIKQETSNEKLKLSNITQKLADERKEHDEKSKLKAEARERKEKDLLEKQRKEHEAATSKMKKKHKEELNAMKQDYEKQLQQFEDKQNKTIDEASTPKQTTKDEKKDKPKKTSSSKSAAGTSASGSQTPPQSPTKKDQKKTNKKDSSSRDSSLYEYETEEEIRSL